MRSKHFLKTPLVWLPTELIKYRVYILRLIARTIVGPVDPKLENLPDANKYEKIVSVAFASILIAVGVWPALLLDSINVGISSIMSVL